MGIDLVPVPPIRDLSTPQAVQRLMAYLHEQAFAMQRLSDNAETPATPTAIAVRQGTGKIVEITVTFAEPADLQWGSTELWRSTTNDVTTATRIKDEKTHDFNDSAVSFGTTYYYFARVKSASNSALVSGWSPSSGHSITVSQVLTADVADANITTAKVADANITTAKVADANITTAKVANNAVTGAKIGTGSNGVATNNVVGNAITTSKRQTQNSLTWSYGLGAEETHANTFTHNLGVIPNYAIDAGQVEWSIPWYYKIYDISTSVLRVALWSQEAVSGTMTLYYW